jgi:hypothetical protein
VAWALHVGGRPASSAGIHWREGSVTPRASRDAGDMRKLKALPRIDPRFFGSSALSLVAIPLSLVTKTWQGNLVPVSFTLRQVNDFGVQWALKKLTRS